MQSFFEHEPSAACERGRILLVSYHFPPAQTAGALRWRKLAGFAHERGWGIDVITRDPSELALSDPTSLQDLPPGIRVFGVADPLLAIERLETRLFATYRKLRSRLGSKPDESDGATANSGSPVASNRVTSLARGEQAFRFSEPRTWVRGYWAAIDFARGRKWARRVAALGRRILDPRVHRLVISSGPPHMAHEAARLLSIRSGLPMLMDLRDAWSLNERTPESLASPVYFWLGRYYERRAVRQAALITMNTEPARAAMQRTYPATADRIEAIPNAYDQQPIPKVDRKGPFLVAYAGTIYLDRTPRTIFKAAALLIDELSLEPEDFALEFMGHIESADGETIEDLAECEGLDRFVRTHPPAKYASAEQFMARASILVSLPQDSHLAIPSKIFDYMRFEARILVLAEPESATALHLQDSDADVVAPDDIASVHDLLRDAYQRYVAGERAQPLTRDPRFSRRDAANRLFDAIDRVLEPADPIGSARPRVRPSASPT